ncbi:MAG: KH domain-containing protein [Candidatus Methanomethyliaceae archaeon]|nr:KH domain-containing protein [Candidatus Methanomethyliaceae archaeon]
MAEEIMSRIYLRIPVERAGVLIGNKGGTKAELEKGTGTSISVDGKSGEIVIECPAGSIDPSGILKVRDLINAIGRGFSPQRAFRLFTDGQMLEVIDLKQVIGDSRNQLVRVKGRIIGENGKTRRIIESLAGTAISVYGHTVAMIGDYYEIRVAKEAIEMLLKGAQHGTVYRFLNKEHLELKKRKLSLWEERPELRIESKEKEK